MFSPSGFSPASQWFLLALSLVLPQEAWVWVPARNTSFIPAGEESMMAHKYFQRAEMRTIYDRREAKSRTYCKYFSTMVLCWWGGLRVSYNPQWAKRPHFRKRLLMCCPLVLVPGTSCTLLFDCQLPSLWFLLQSLTEQLMQPGHWMKV